MSGEAGQQALVADSLRRAIIVDDSLLMVAQLSGILKQLGYSSIAMAPAQLEQREIDPAEVIFVELLLEHANGFALIRQLAAHGSSKLILLTGSGRDSDQQWGLRAGAVAVLTRPLALTQVREVLAGLAVPECRV